MLQKAAPILFLFLLFGGFFAVGAMEVTDWSPSLLQLGGGTVIIGVIAYLGRDRLSGNRPQPPFDR